MAFGFIPKFEQIVQLNQLSAESYLAIALKTLETLGWETAQVNSAGFTAYTGNSAFGKDSEIHLALTHEQATLVSKSLGSEMFDFNRNRKFIEKFIQEFNEIHSSLSEDDLAVLVTNYHDFIAASEDDSVQQPHTAFQGVKSFFFMFVPQGGYIVTPIIIDINIVIFLLMALSGVNILSPDTESLINWGASFKPLIVQGESWRLFTNIFLHIGIFHLLLNMYALAYVGLLLEHRIGTFKFTVAYLCTGIAASIVSVCWHSYTVGAGASGAIFGLYGVFLALLTGNFIDKAMRKALLTSISVFVGYNLVNGLKDGIDNAAHIGGLVSGLLIGYAFIPSLKRPERKTLNYLTLGGITAFILLTSTIIVALLQDDIGIYDSKMKIFYNQESMALEVFSLPKTTSKENILFEIKERGLYYWNANIELVNQVDSLNLPDPAHLRNKKLIDYCQLRLKSYQLMYKAVAEDTNIYKPQIDAYDNQIGKIIEELKQQ